MLEGCKEITEITQNRFAVCALGRQLEGVVLIDLGDKVDLPLTQFAQTEISKTRELQHKVIDGKTYYYDDNGMPYRIDNGLSPNSQYIHAETVDRCPLDSDGIQENVLVESLDGDKEDSHRLPRNGGGWTGEPGNSQWKPDPDAIPGDRNGTNPHDKSWKEIMDQYDFDAILFEDGVPDFSEVSKGNVEIDDFSDNRRRNFVQADEKLAEQKGCQASEVRQWRADNKYTWHEEADCKTMRKVPSEIHGNIPHDGGISEVKNQKSGQE